MLGTIAGDVIGSAYEAHPIKSIDFPLFGRYSRFTDDTVLTIATAYSILEKVDYAEAFRTFGRRFPRAGYGASFYQWMYLSQGAPYNSWGNGSAMRVSPVGFAFGTVEEVLEEARRTASVTHNHPEGIKGAQATALAVFLARNGENRDSIRTEIEGRFDYNLKRTIDDIRPGYHFDVSCQGSVPESITAFLESRDFDDAVRKAVSLGGDSDTMACIAGGIAHAFYRKMPEDIVTNVRERLPAEFLEIMDRFMGIYGL